MNEEQCYLDVEKSKGILSKLFLLLFSALEKYFSWLGNFPSVCNDLLVFTIYWKNTFLTYFPPTQKLRWPNNKTTQPRTQETCIENHKNSTPKTRG
jgi:hypothetical protein